ncbi:hypothetical protein [Psychroserpens mesophilus]|uniref:hypothetical protein n=1 Tax=Psychroserpens mesophilus TaxID=325473 RepID=UPI00058D83DB|nr:hypothetical protein [Psychroserpens mesophilus]
MKTTEQERDTLIKIFEQVPFDEHSFVWYILNTYIHSQIPEFPVLELSSTKEMHNLKGALVDVFDLVRTRIIRVV